MKDLPPLPYSEWRDTRDTLHRWLQIVGKIRLRLTPLINHWWNVPLYVSPRGLTTSSIAVGDRRFEIELDFIDHVLRVVPHDRKPQIVELAPRSVADFYAATMAALRAADVDCRIWSMPVETAGRTPFEHDVEHCAYDKAYVTRFWEVLSRVDAVLTKFRAGFIGKCSPVHFFWGSMDLAVTRFSGRRAPAFEGSAMDREAYSHEVSSVGWWPGDERLERPSFYSYAAPEPPGFAAAPIAAPAYHHPTLKGFYLDHDAVRQAGDPERTLLDFCQTTYAAAADLGNWPRADLERNAAENDDGHVLSPSDQGQRAGSNEGMRGVPEPGR
jgi:hypothetical protein